MPVGGEIKAKVFLEGVEVPFIGASITSAVNSASIAYVDIVPLDEIRHIKPRTHVVIALKDDVKGGYILAWEGEVFGYNFGRTVSSRTMTLNCIDFSGYWDSVLTYYFDATKAMNKAGDIGSVGQDVKLAKQAQIAIQKLSFGNTSLYLDIFRDTLKQKGKNELDAFVAIFDKLSAANAFYDFADKRFRISERYLLASTGDLGNLLKGQNAIEWFKGMGGVVSGFHSLRELVMMFLGIIFHDVVPVPFPARVTTSRLKVKDEKQRLNSPKKVDKTIGQFIFKPNIYMCPPPACNVFYPDEYSSFQFSRNFLQEPTRFAYQPQFVTFQGNNRIHLDWVYQPDSFRHYMQEQPTKKPKQYEGKNDLEVTYIKTPDGNQAIPGFFREKLNNEYKDSAHAGLAREHHFMTNEELYKGIILAKESGFPAASSFTDGLDKSFKKNITEQITRYSFFKKRFQTRSLQITSHLKTSVVPGFPVLILDDSEAQHHVVAYCDSVTHRIYATEGGYTNLNLSFARTVDEQNISSNEGQDPFLPNWFLSTTFGATADIKGEGKRIQFPQKDMAAYYKAVLGDKGYMPITSLHKDFTTISSATKVLMDEYNREKKSEGGIQALINKRSRRDFVTLPEAFRFLGANTATTNQDEEFQNYNGDVYNLKNYDIGSIIKNKRSVIEGYQERLKTTRGIRG